MKATEFCYWLQGLFELSDPTSLNDKQTDLIKRHLNLVFIHDIDPSYPAEQQAALNKAHNKEEPKNFMGMTEAQYKAAGSPRC